VGISEVNVSYLNVTNDIDPQESLFYDQDLAAEVFQEAKTLSKKLGIHLRLPPLPRADAYERSCFFPWNFCQIDTDGAIRFCYKAWTQRLGNVNEDFKSVWRGTHYQRIRSTMDSESPYFPYCQHCAMKKGIAHESAHNQKLHSDCYTIKGLEHLQTGFNERAMENRIAIKEMKQQRKDGHR
jgi:radical SAM protein with 4Fe4S-binding SPASM domain